MSDSNETTAPLPQLARPIDKDKEIARLTKLVIYYAEQSGVTESVVRKTWKI